LTPDEIIFPFFEAIPKLAQVKQALTKRPGYGDPQPPRRGYLELEMNLIEGIFITTVVLSITTVVLGIAYLFWFDTMELATMCHLVGGADGDTVHLVPSRD